MEQLYQDSEHDKDPQERGKALMTKKMDNHTDNDPGQMETGSSR